jgi:hypothetical protein
MRGGDVFVVVLPLKMVDNSMSSQELISGSFFFHSTGITGYFILSVPAPTCFHPCHGGSALVHKQVSGFATI